MFSVAVFSVAEVAFMLQLGGYQHAAAIEVAFHFHKGTVGRNEGGGPQAGGGVVHALAANVEGLGRGIERADAAAQFHLGFGGFLLHETGEQGAIGHTVAADFHKVAHGHRGQVDEPDEYRGLIHPHGLVERGEGLAGCVDGGDHAIEFGLVFHLAGIVIALGIHAA